MRDHKDILWESLLFLISVLTLMCLAPNSSIEPEVKSAPTFAPGEISVIFVLGMF